MARNRELPVHRMLPLAGLALATGGVFLSDPLSNLSKNGPDKISVFIQLYVYVYVHFLTPVTLYLNNVLLFLHITALNPPPLPVFLKRYLSRAAGTVSLANLLLVAPLLVHLSVAEKSVGLVIGATLVVLSLILIFASVFKKILVSNCPAGRGFMPVFFALCISIGTLFIASESMFKFDKKHHSLAAFIPIQQLLSLISFFVFMLGIALLLICIVNTAAGGPRVPIHAQNLLISALCVVTATLLVGWYMIAYMTVTGMRSVLADAVELL